MAAATVLLRWVSVCVVLCLLGAAGLYLATQLSEDTSLHRREMNAAAYRAQLYFDQREALLNYLADSVVPLPPRAADLPESAGTAGLHYLQLGTSHGTTPLMLPLSEKTERTLVALGAQLLHVSMQPGAPVHWLHTSHPPTALALPELDATSLQKGATRAFGAPKVSWMASSQKDAKLYLYRTIGDEHAPGNWLVLSLDATAVSHALTLHGAGSTTLFNTDGTTFFTSPSGAELPVRWLDEHRNDSFSIVWFGGLPRGLALVKSVGEDDWRLVYHLPMAQLIGEMGGHIAGALLLCLFAAATLWALMRRVDRQLITPARKQHTQLLESFDFAATVIDMAPVGMCVLRWRDGVVMLENQLARDWLGVDTANGDWSSAWRHPSALPDGLQTLPPVNFSTHDGRQLQVLYAATRYHGEDVLLCVFNDISQQHHVQSVLEAARTAADTASKAKSAFVAMLSHEIRTPLYGMLGTLELLLHTKLDEKQARYLRLIQQSSSVLQQLIGDTLDVSRIEAGQLTLTVSAFSPLDLAEATLRSYADSARRKRLQILVCTDPLLPARVLGDADRIRQVLGNLLSNAIKFTDSGRIFLRVGFLQCQDGVASLSWQVTDTGKGITASEQAHLFVPFGQLDGPARRQGTGLGLSISDHLVRMMKGTLRLVSEPGLGSSFTVVLPLPVATATEAAAEDDEPQLLPSPPVYIRASVPELVDSATQWLQRWGATVLPHAAGTAPIVAGAILLDSDPHDSLAANWPGPRVIALPEAGDLPSPDPTHPDQVTVTLFSIRAIAQSIAYLQRIPPASVPASDVPAQPVDAGLGLRVLATEDNPINLLLLREQLETLGCKVVTARDGNEALAYFANDSFDAVLTDLNMPEMDGLTLTHHLRERGFVLPIIGTSADASEQERARCLREGMDDYLLKPIHIDALRRALSPKPATALHELPD